MSRFVPNHSDRLDKPPEHAVHHETREGTCSRCHKKVGGTSKARAWRCPWVACRAWLIGTLDGRDVDKEQPEHA